MKAKFLNLYILFFCILSITAIDVSTVEELHTALAKAKAGQIISIAPGEYDYSTYERKKSFLLRASGASSRPITLTAQDPENPPVLLGPDISRDGVLEIRGDYWVIENIKIANSGQGIILDNANNNTFSNIEIYSVGSLAVYLRANSSYNLFQNCYIHGTGNADDNYGYGLFIESPILQDGKIVTKSDYNVIKGCVFRYIVSDPIVFRNCTKGNEVVKSVFYGDGINGKKRVRSFMRIEGDENYIHDNVIYRNSNRNIDAAFKVVKSETSGDGNIFANNVLFMDRPDSEVEDRRIFVVDGPDASISVKNNKIDYGDGLVDADKEEFYNSDSVTFLK